MADPQEWMNSRALPARRLAQPQQWSLLAHVVGAFSNLLHAFANGCCESTEQSQHYQTNAHSLTPKYFAASAGGMSFAKRPIISAVNALRLFRLDYTSSRLQSDPLTWADVISKCTEGAAFLAEVQMSKLEKTAAANCKTLAHDAKQRMVMQCTHQRPMLIAPMHPVSTFAVRSEPRSLLRVAFAVCAPPVKGSRCRGGVEEVTIGMNCAQKQLACVAEQGVKLLDSLFC